MVGVQRITASNHKHEETMLRGSETSRSRGRETRRHDYTRLPAALSNELGGLSTSLGLSTSPLLILWTESVVVMEWKGMSTAIATRAALPVDAAIDERLPRATPSQGRLVKLLLVDLCTAEWHAQTAHRMAHTRSAQSIAVRMRLTASSHARRAVRQDAREHATRFPE